MSHLRLYCPPVSLFSVVQSVSTKVSGRRRQGRFFCPMVSEFGQIQYVKSLAWGCAQFRSIVKTVGEVRIFRVEPLNDFKGS